MALDKTLKGPQIVAYYHYYWSRLTWRQVKVPAPYREHWVAYHQGQAVGEFFRGKSNMYYGIVYRTARRGFLFFRKDRQVILHTLTAYALGPEH